MDLLLIFRSSFASCLCTRPALTIFLVQLLDELQHLVKRLELIPEFSSYTATALDFVLTIQGDYPCFIHGLRLTV
jgi:hypothetical protein